MNRYISLLSIMLFYYYLYKACTLSKGQSGLHISTAGEIHPTKGMKISQKSNPILEKNKQTGFPTYHLEFTVRVIDLLDVIHRCKQSEL